MMVNVVEMMDPIVHFIEMMSRYENLCGKPIMMSDE